jgi:hypothetical protein
VSITGGSGDADLYTLFGSPPTASNFDCRPYLYGNNEACSEKTPQAGAWHIGLHAYDDFSAVSITASYQEGGSDPDPEPVAQCITADNLTHIGQGRAYRCGWWRACAVGSGNNLGRARSTVVTSLREVSENYWEQTEGCP